MEQVIYTLAGVGGISGAYGIIRVAIAGWRWLQAARKAKPQMLQDQLADIRQLLEDLTSRMDAIEPKAQDIEPIPDPAKGEV